MKRATDPPSTPRPRATSRSRAAASDHRRADAAESLVPLGLRPGDAVRFRSSDGKRWRDGVVTGRERDGSIALTDERGHARAIPVDRLEVRTRGKRGGHGWEPLSVRAAREEQLPLW